MYHSRLYGMFINNNSMYCAVNKYLHCMNIQLFYMKWVFSIIQRKSIVSVFKSRKKYNTDTPAHRHTGTPTYRYTGTPAHRHTGTPAHRHTGTPAHRHTSTPTHWHTYTAPTNILDKILTNGIIALSVSTDDNVLRTSTQS